jgi:hypothetical protein
LSAQRTSGTGETHAAAVVRVVAPSGRLRTFEAEKLEVTGPYVNSTGRWRDDPSDQRRTYTWPARQLVEVRWVA